MTYLIGRDLGGPLAGGLAALVLAWHPLVLDEARFGRCYGLVLLWSALLVWFTFRWRREPRAWRWSLAWGVAAAALAWTHYLAVPFAVSIGRGGALFSVGAGIVLAISYWVAFSLFAALGAGGVMPALLAAWAPNLLFGAGAVYLLLTVRT